MYWNVYWKRCCKANYSSDPGRQYREKNGSLITTVSMFGGESGRNRPVGREGGRNQGVVGPHIVRIPPGCFGAAVESRIDTGSQGGANLAEGRRVGIELVGQIVQDESDESGRPLALR